MFTFNILLNLVWSDKIDQYNGKKPPGYDFENSEGISVPKFYLGYIIVQILHLKCI